jgi:hypothetical protein
MLGLLLGLGLLPGLVRAGQVNYMLKPQTRRPPLARRAAGVQRPVGTLVAAPSPGRGHPCTSTRDSGSSLA